MLIGETYSKLMLMQFLPKQIWVLLSILKTKNMETCNPISLAWMVKMISLCMMLLLTKQTLVQMQTGPRKQVMPKLLTKDINKIHTERNKHSSLHKYLSKLIILSINPWTSQNLTSITSLINTENKITCTLIFLAPIVLVQNHKKS